MTNLAKQLAKIVGEKNLLTGKNVSDRNSGLSPDNLHAKVLVRPETTEQVASIMKLCHATGQSVVCQGGLTGLAEGASTTADDIILSLEKLNVIEDIDPIGKTISVQAGVLLQNIQEAALNAGLIFPLDLGARGSCTIGGNISTNAGGNQVIRYGMTRDLVLGLEVVLADGSIMTSMNRMIKNNSGYDLKHMFIGSEGTLGVVTRAVLKLCDSPAEKQAVLIATDSFDKVVKLLGQTQKDLGAKLGSFEVMWQKYYDLTVKSLNTTPPIDGDYPYYILIEALCDSTNDKDIFQSTLEHSFETELIVDAVIAKSDAEQALFWEIRDNSMCLYDHYSDVFSFDTSTPIPDAGAFVEIIETELGEKFPQLDLYVMGHLGDGNLHPMVCGNDAEETRHKVESIIYNALEKFGGAVSAEHGIGLEKKAYLHLSRTETEIAMMKTLKRAFDPKSILNPGKIISA